MVISHATNSRTSLALPITSPSLLEETPLRAQSARNMSLSPIRDGSPKHNRTTTGMLSRTSSTGMIEGGRKRGSFANMSKHGVPARASNTGLAGARIKAFSETLNVELTPLCKQLVHPKRLFTVKLPNKIEEENFPQRELLKS